MHVARKVVNITSTIYSLSYFVTAPATFQWLMHDLLTGMIFNRVIVYQEGILVYGKSENKYYKILTGVFDKFENPDYELSRRNAGFFKLNYCFFTVTS